MQIQVSLNRQNSYKCAVAEDIEGFADKEQNKSQMESVGKMQKV